MAFFYPKLRTLLYTIALRVNSRQDGKNINKALYVALAINWEGRKEVFGSLACRHGRSKVLDECSNGHKKPWNRRYSHCLFVSYKDLKAVCRDLKEVYSAVNAGSGHEALEEFGKKWNNKYPMIQASWERNWNNLTEFFNYPKDIRRAIYTTNAIESLNFSLRKVTRNKSRFPDDDSIYKVMYLAIKNASARWTMPIKDWGLAVNQFAILFDGRVPGFN